MPRHRYALIAIVLVGLGVRVGYSLTTGQSDKLNTLEGQIAHGIVADRRWFAYNTKVESYIAEVTGRRRQIVDPASVDLASAERGGQWYPDIGQSIGAAAVIAGVWAVSGDERYIQVQILQGIIDAFAALLVYWIALVLFKRRRAALLAAALYALYPPLAWQTADPYNDIWAVDFTLAVIAAYLMTSRSPHGWRWTIICGLLGGVGAYFRPQVILIVPVLAAATFAVAGWHRALVRAALATLVAMLLLVPWTIRNYRDFHTFVPTRTGLWETMWAGMAELPNDFGISFSAGPTIASVHRVRPGLVYETPAFDAYMKHEVLSVITHHPLFYGELLLYRIGISTLLAHETLWMRGGAGAALHNRGAPLSLLASDPFEVLEYALQPLVFLLAMLGLTLSWRGFKRQHIILGALVASILLPYIVINVEGRYLLPAYFAYFIWIGLGIDAVIERVPVRWASRSAGRG